MRERSEKNKPQDSKNKAQTTLEETRVDTRKQRRKPSQKQKEPQLARSTKVDTRQTTNTKNPNNCVQKKRKCKRNEGPAKQTPLTLTLKRPKGSIT